MSPEAIAELIEPHRKPLFAYIYRMVTHRQDAEDLMQDVFVRVMESIGRYRGDGPFKSWLFGIATHACLDLLRSRRRWRVEAQIEGEKATDASAEDMSGLRGRSPFAATRRRPRRRRWSLRPRGPPSRASTLAA